MFSEKLHVLTVKRWTIEMYEEKVNDFPSKFLLFPAGKTDINIFLHVHNIKLFYHCFYKFIPYFLQWYFMNIPLGQ